MLGNSFVLFANNVASGATGVETAITLNRVAGMGGSGIGAVATSSAASFVPSSGKHIVITSILFATRGNSVATAQISTLSLRLNTGGAVTTSSTPILYQVQSATPVTASAYDRALVTFPNGYEILTADGIMQIGVTAKSIFTTNAPTWDIVITGYEYF